MKSKPKYKTSKKPDQAIKVALGLLADANKAAATASTGACIYLPPGSTQPKCFMLTPGQCSAIKGTYVGGKCS